MTTQEAERIKEDRLIQIIDTHRAGLLTYVRRLVGSDPTRAEDVVQETFVRAWRQIDRLTPEHGSVSGWLHRVAYNIAMDGHRMRQVRPTEVELVNWDVATLDDHSRRTVTAVAIGQILERVWPEHRAVLEEVYLRDRSTAQAAQALGIPVGTVKSRLYYALRNLRETVRDETLLAS